MTDLNNINMNVRSAYSAQGKKQKEEDVKPECKEACCKKSTANESALRNQEMINRALVNKGLNAETLNSVKEAIEFYQKNQAIAAAAVNSVDHACDLGASYEKACVGCCDAAHAKASN